MTGMKYLVGIAALLMCVGCSAAANVPSSSPVASVSSPAATTAQWASAIAPIKKDWEETQKSWDDATCSAIAAGEGAADCATLLATMQIQVATIHLKVSSLTKPDSSTYLGQPPTEVAAAYEALQEAASAADIWESAPVHCPGKTCGRAAVEFESSWKDLGSALVAWEPWL